MLPQPFLFSFPLELCVHPHSIQLGLVPTPAGTATVWDSYLLVTFESQPYAFCFFLPIGHMAQTL